MEQILDFGNGQWGEDRLYAGDKVSFVIDGATPISKQPYNGYHSGAEWLAEELKQYLIEHLSDAEVPVLCKQFTDKAGESVKTMFPSVQEMPSMTIAAIAGDGDMLKGYVLGDCSLYILLKDGGIKHVTDRRTDAFYQKTMNAKRNAEAHGADVTAAVLEQRRKNKATMNQQGGYWTVSFVGDYEQEFYTCSVPVAEVQSVLLCTDGFDRAFCRGMFTPECVLRGEESLKTVLERLREAEKESDADVKRHDDASAILILPSEH